MLTPKDRLIESALRSFSDNSEMQMSARHVLGELVKEDPPHAEEIISRWEVVDKGMDWPRWQWGLYFVLAIVSLVVLFMQKKDILGEYHLWTSFASPTRYEKALQDVLSEDLNAQQKLHLFGDTGRSLESDRMKALWDSEPDNPAYFLEYARAHVSDHKKLPVKFLETAKRIDPDNAWFTYFAAAVEAYECVKLAKKSPKQARLDEANQEPRLWDIQDAVKLERAIEIFQSASAQSRCENYSMRIGKQRSKLLDTHTVVESLYVSRYKSDLGWPDAVVLRELTNVVSAKVTIFQKNGKNEDLKKLISASDVFIQHMVNLEAVELWKTNTYKRCVGEIVVDLGSSAAKLGLKEEADRLLEIKQRFMANKKILDDRKREIDRSEVGGKSFKESGGTLVGNLTPQIARSVLNPPSLTKDHLKPGRLAEHDFLSWMRSLAAWLAFSLILMIALVSCFWSSVLVRKISDRVVSLIRPIDWLWVLGIGVLLPFIWMISVNRFTPLGGRDSSMLDRSGVITMTQFLAMGLLFVMMPLKVAEWRLGKISTFKEKEVKSSRLLDRILMIFGWLAIPLTGILGIIDSKIGSTLAEWLLKISFFTFIFSYAILILIGIINHGSNLIYNKVYHRMMIPIYAFSALIMICAAPFFKASERHWFTQDTISRIHPDYPMVSPYEYQVANEMRKELREIVGKH
jgi:hypothetical protein